MRRFLLLAFCVACLVPGLALASWTATGSIVSVNGPEASPASPASFTGNFEVSFVETHIFIDCFRVRTISGPSFLPPDVLTGMPAGWSPLWEFPNDAAAEGPGVNPIFYSITWDGPLTDFSYAIALYGGGGPPHASLIWDYDAAGNFFTVTPTVWDPGKDPAPTPEPATWFSLIAGMGVLGWMRFRG